MSRNKKLSQQFYLSEEVERIAKNLLGKYLITEIDGQRTSGMIVETECYRGPEDKGSHAYNNKRTHRTETMYAQGGVAYIYLCYGLHHLFNIVTGPKEIPHAVLIRAIQPMDGISTMLKRRKLQKLNARLTAGPGILTNALGITKELNGSVLTKNPIWLEDRGEKVTQKEIIACPRIGIDYAEEYRDLPWRFCLRNSSWLSQPYFFNK